MKASVLTVIYNRAVDEVTCLWAALASPLVCEVVVCDNGSVSADNAARAESLGARYVPMGGNAGLPKAYNAGIAACTGDVVCVFDDDTEVGPDYFEALDQLWDSEVEWDIALPLVTAGSRILSPCRFDGYRARLFHDVSEVKDELHLSGINSGMAVKRAAFEFAHYDESLFLDLVDHKFISDARVAGLKVAYLEGPVLRQGYSLQEDNAEQTLRRLRIFERDSLAFYSGVPGGRAYRAAMLAWRKAKFVARFRSLRFFVKDDAKRKALQ